MPFHPETKGLTPLGRVIQDPCQHSERILRFRPVSTPIARIDGENLDRPSVEAACGTGLPEILRVPEVPVVVGIPAEPAAGLPRFRDDILDTRPTHLTIEYRVLHYNRADYVTTEAEARGSPHTTVWFRRFS